MAQRVLFLCTGNYYRSRFAEIYFNWQAERRGWFWFAESRGLALNDCNNGPISRHTLSSLEARRISSNEFNRFPLSATEADLMAADHIIAVKESEHRPLVEARFPAWRDRVEYWHIDDIDCASPDDAIPRLEREVLRLMDRLVPMRMSA